jgi:hypothetical protein
MMQRALVAGGVAWTAPVVMTLAEPVAAATPSGLSSCPTVYCFDTGTTEGWSIDNTAGSGGGLWGVSSGRSVSPSNSMHYGNGVGGTYNTGAANGGTVTSPVFTLPASGAMDLEMDVWREIELWTGNGNWDVFTISMLPTAGPAATLYQVFHDGGTSGAFQRLTFDLSAWASQSAQIAITFDTVDSAYNDFEGIWIDNISIPCSTPPAAAGGAGLRAFTPGYTPDLPPPSRSEMRRRRRAQGSFTGSASTDG